MDILEITLCLVLGLTVAAILLTDLLRASATNSPAEALFRRGNPLGGLSSSVPTLDARYLLALKRLPPEVNLTKYQLRLLLAVRLTCLAAGVALLAGITLALATGRA